MTTRDHKEYKSRAILGEYQTPKMVLWMLKHSGGILKTQQQAAYVLFFFILFTMVAVPYIVLRASGVIQHPQIYAPVPEILQPGNTLLNNYPH